MIGLALLVGLAASWLEDPLSPAVAPPKDPKVRIERLFELDRFVTKTQLEADQIARELALVPIASAADEKRWTAASLAIAAKRPKLPKKSGRHFTWEKEEKGMFILGGELGKPKGLLVAMHGGGKGSGDAWSAHGVYQGSASKLDWLMIAPEVLQKTEHGWTDSGTEEWVLGLVESALRTWKIDPDRVFLSGHSMGGYGTWSLGAHHADRVAGLAASAGAPSPIFDGAGNVTDIQSGIVPNLRNVPFIIYQSDDDPNVPPAANRAAAKKLGEARERWGGFPFEYWEVPSRQHDLPPGGMTALLAKIADSVRDPRPAKVVWQPALRWKRQCYWLWWEMPNLSALVEAEVDRTTNEVRVKCDASTKGLEVLLDARLVDITKEVRVLVNGAEVYKGIPAPDLGTIAKTSLHGDPELVFARRVKLGG